MNGIIGVINHHRVGWYYHPRHPFDRIYQPVSLLRCTGSFPLSLFTCRSDLVRVRVLLRSTVSIDSSLYRVVPDIFLSLYMLVVLVLVVVVVVVVVLLLRPTLVPSTPTGMVTPSLDRGIDIQWIRTHLSHKPIV